VRSLNEYNEMKQAMLRSEGALLYSDLLALHRSLQVFLGNCDQLLGFMSSHLDGSPDRDAALGSPEPRGLQPLSG
jgi:hypothetical protein